MSEEIEIGILPPQAIDIEEGVLGSMMIDHEALIIALDRLKEEDFFKPFNRNVFKAVKELHEQNISIDIISVEQYLYDHKELANPDQGEVNYLTRSVASPSNIDYYAQIILEKAMLRQLILESNQILKNSYEPGADPYEILTYLKEITDKIESHSFYELPESSNDITAQVLTDTLEERNIHDGINGLPTYLPIDLLTAGFPDGEMITIAARPSMGKTAFLLTIVMNLLLNDYDKPILLFSYEMSKEILLLRLLCMIGKVDMQFARRGKLNDKEKNRLLAAARKIGVNASFDFKEKKVIIESIENSNLYIEDSNMHSVEDMERIAHRLKMNNDLGVILIDYLQLIPIDYSSNRRFGTRDQEISHISRNLKKMAKKFKIPVISLSQLSRKVEDRPGDNRPRLSDLRESGSIEQDSTMVIFLYRPEYYDIKVDDSGITTAGLCEVILKKNRNGPIGTEKHLFEKQYAIFGAWNEEQAINSSGSRRPPEHFIMGRDDPADFQNEDDAPF